MAAPSHFAEMLIGRLSEVSLSPLALALTLHLAKLGARARAWQHRTPAYPADRLRFRGALAAFLAGVGVSAFVPARAGQLVRLRLPRSRVASSTFPGLVSTLVAESVVDTTLTVVLIGSAAAAGFGDGAAGGASLVAPVVQHPVIAALAASAWPSRRARLAFGSARASGRFSGTPARGRRFQPARRIPS